MVKIVTKKKTWTDFCEKIDEDVIDYVSEQFCVDVANVKSVRKEMFAKWTLTSAHKNTVRARSTLPYPNQGGGAHCVQFVKYLRNALSKGLETFWTFKWANGPYSPKGKMAAACPPVV